MGQCIFVQNVELIDLKYLLKVFCGLLISFSVFATDTMIKQPVVHLALEGTYETREIRSLTRYPDGKETEKFQTITIFNPLNSPIYGSLSLSIGHEVISQDQKMIPFFLIGQFLCYDEYASLVGKQVYLEGTLEPSNDPFFFHIPQISLDYVVDVKWKDEPCETLLYEPNIISIEGRVTEFSGLQEDEGAKNGHANEVSLILTLDKPVHVGKAGTGEYNGIDIPEKYVTEMVLIPPDGLVGALLVNKRARVTGVLFHAHTAHHQRRILCDAKTVTLL